MTHTVCNHVCGGERVMDVEKCKGENMWCRGRRWRWGGGEIGKWGGEGVGRWGHGGNRCKTCEAPSTKHVVT